MRLAQPMTSIPSSSPTCCWKMLLLRVHAPGLYLLLGLFALSAFDDSAASSSTLKYGPHLADVNILMPPLMTFPVEYRLLGTDGCFDWSWDHHDVLSVLPEYKSSSRCSTSALLKSTAPYSGRKETAVYATDLNSGMVIQCKVYIDIFSRIQIFHSSFKLDLDGLASLRVCAFDSEENVFSSLVGLQFIWKLMTEAEGVPHHLVHVPIKDSPQSDCGGLCGDLDIQAKLEDSGVFSDLFVVKGVEIGQEFVSVHLSEPLSKKMRDIVLLTVAEAISLEPPSPVFVIVGAVVDYTLKVIRGNVPLVVPLPSPYHLWSASNSSVAQVDMYVGETRALNLGMTTVNVRDTRIADHVQTSTLHVVLPDTLLLHILPLSPFGSPTEGAPSSPSMERWYVVTGRKYFVEVKVFKQRPGAEEIYITDSDAILIADDQIELWNLLPASDNISPKKSIRILEAMSYGLGKLMAVLTYIGTIDKRKEVIKVVQEVMVCDEVKFIGGQGRGSRSRILLPWAPGVSQGLDLRVIGGCAMASSDYKWLSSNTAVVSVSASGVIRSKSPGKATIKAVSPYDFLNYDEIIVEVSGPSSIIMLHIQVKFPVGSHIQAFFFERFDALHSSIIPLGRSLDSLTDAARLSIVASLRVNPEFSLLLFSSESMLSLTVTGGSCFMETSVNDTHILEVIQPPLDLHCVQVMLVPKRLGAALVTVYDIGISPAVAASSVVQVADLDWIKILCMGEISIMQGNLLAISFIAGIDEGNVFDSSQYVFMKIHVRFEKDIIELVDDSLVEGQAYRYVRASDFSLRGTRLGVTTFYLSAWQHSGQQVLSQTIKVEVYSPPRLVPDEIFLVPGASYFLKFSSMDDETAEFQKMLGPVTAISPGNTTVVATFYVKENMVLCQAFVRTSVGIPSEALLNVQSDKLAVGRLLPIFPSLSEGDLFSFYELCSSFKWTVEDEEVMSFHDIQGLENGIPFASDKLVKEDIGFLRALQGLSPRKTDVSVTFSCDVVSTGSFSESRLYSARLSLWVVPDLPLALRSPITWILPPHYTASDLLPVPSNPHKWDTSVRGKVAYSVLGDFGEEAQYDVISIDGRAMGTKEAISILIRVLCSTVAYLASLSVMVSTFLCLINCLAKFGAFILHLGAFILHFVTTHSTPRKVVMLRGRVTMSQQIPRVVLARRTVRLQRKQNMKPSLVRALLLLFRSLRKGLTVFANVIMDFFRPHLAGMDMVLASIDRYESFLISIIVMRMVITTYVVVVVAVVVFLVAVYSYLCFTRPIKIRNRPMMFCQRAAPPESELAIRISRFDPYPSIRYNTKKRIQRANETQHLPDDSFLQTDFPTGRKFIFVLKRAKTFKNRAFQAAFNYEVLLAKLFFKSTDVVIHGLWSEGSEDEHIRRQPDYETGFEWMYLNALGCIMPYFLIRHEWRKHGIHLFWNQVKYYWHMIRLYGLVAGAVEDVLEGSQKANPVWKLNDSWSWTNKHILQDKIYRKTGIKVQIKSKRINGEDYVDEIRIWLNEYLQIVDYPAPAYRTSTSVLI